MDPLLFRKFGHDIATDEYTAPTGVPAGKATVTSRMGGGLVLRVADPETAWALGQALSGGRKVQRERDGNGVAPDADAAVARAAGGTGAALPTHVQQQFEGSTGADLSGVRVHTGPDSAAAAHAVGAKAYTVGQDIHFAAGRYQPDDPFGMHLLAHEVAHTVQQSGGAAHRQNQLEVSTPADTLEHEADRAADAMVRGAPTSIGGAAPALARDLDTDAAADAGEKAMVPVAQGDIVLQVSNATDVSDVNKALTMLEANQERLEKGASMISPHQRDMGEHMRDMRNGGKNKMLTQVPLEAIGHNAALISDIHLYLVEAGGQTMVTDQFQGQYKALQGNFGRLEGVAKSFGIASFKEQKAGDAEATVQNAVESGGHTTGELSKTFQELLDKDPSVRGARETVLSTTAELEKMPGRVTSDFSTCTSAIQTLRSAITTATVAEKGANSLKLRNKLQQAKAAGEQAAKLTDAAVDLAKTGSVEALKTIAKGIAGAGAMTAAKWGTLAAEGAATGGEAIVMAAIDKLVVEPAKDLIGRAVKNADAAVGVVSEEDQLEADLDAEKAKQDMATIETFKLARKTLSSSGETAVKAVTTFVKTAVEVDLRKKAAKAAFDEFSAAIKKASGARGKGSQGKALAEMAGFLHEAEQFIVQANIVIDTVKKDADIHSSDSANSIPAKARAALDKIKHRTAWMAHTYPFKKTDGTTTTYYGAQEVNLKIAGPGLDATAADLKGKGRADGFSADPAAGTQGSNNVISGVVPSLIAMRDKVLAVRNQISAQVFGTGGGQ